MGGPLLAARNVLKGWLLLVGVSAALGGIGWLLGGYRLLSVFVFCGLLLALGMWWYSDRIALGMLRAREVPVGEAPGLHSTVERLALRAGVAKPRLYRMPDSHPRAFAAGRGPRNSALAVSNGLLSVTAPAELEGVLAHELAHVRNRDLAVQTAVVVFAAALIELSRVGGFLQRMLLFVLAPLAGALVHLMLSPKREFLADQAGAVICGSPHAVADGLIRLEQAGSLVEFASNPATEPLYTVNPFAEEGLALMFVTHPPLDERVRRLRALDPEWREKLRAVA
jgi:heat shock protein HtpX